MTSLGLIASLVGLTFVIPVTQGLISKLIAPSQHGELISSILIILCISFGYERIQLLTLLSTSSFWRKFYYVAGICVSILLIINILNQPVSKISGQVRSPLDVIDVIILGPIAEEFIFRGVMWSIIEKLVKSGHWQVAALLGSSLLFGVEHLGYWALSYWPLPPDALMHAVLMVGAGIGFGSVRIASRSLAPPMIAHMFANGAILLTQ